MRHRRIWRASAFWLTVSLVLSAAVPIGVSAVKPTTPKLGLHDEQLLSKARVEGRATVTILVAAKGGAANQAEAAITNAGGTIRYRDAALS